MKHDLTATTSTATISSLGRLGSQAVGNIGPERVNGRILPQEIEKHLDSFYGPTSRTVVASCIDGRNVGEKTDDLSAAGYGQQDRDPDAAGGTLALWVAFVLGGCDLSLEDFLAALQSAGVPIGGHTDDHEHVGTSGCGANDKLDHILGLLSGGLSLARVVSLAKVLGVPVSEACASQLSQRAYELKGSPLLGTPPQRMALLESYGKTVTLCGGHSEQLVIVNAVPQTTLNRTRLTESLGEQAAAFNVDVWAFPGSLEQAAAALSQDCPEQEYLLAAMVFYNLATALVLCASDMPVVLRSV
jgi:hypothetical protein